MPATGRDYTHDIDGQDGIHFGLYYFVLFCCVPLTVRVRVPMDLCVLPTNAVYRSGWH